MSAHHKLDVCPNCGTHLGHAVNFCPNCGQENHEVKLPLSHIGYEFVESITHFDNKLWNSLKAIFTRPGKMTAEFLAGKRARYVPPARLYVFVSVIFFFLIGKFADRQLEESIHDLTRGDIVTLDMQDLIDDDQLLDSLNAGKLGRKLDLKIPLNEQGLIDLSRRLKRLKPTQLDSMLTKAKVAVTDSTRQKLRSLIELVPDTPRVSTGLDQLFGKRKFKTSEEREAYEEQLSRMPDQQIDSLIRAEGSKPDWFTRKLYRQQSKFSHLGNGENTHELLHAVTKNLSIVMFVLMPFVAVLLLLFYFRRGRLYYEHLIFSVHIHTVLFLLFSIALGITFFSNPALISSVLVWTFWISWLYFLLSIKRVYGQSWGKTIVKFFLLSMMYGLTAMFFLLGALGAGFLTF